MRWSAYAILASAPSTAIPEAVERLIEGLDGEPPDLVLAFVSPNFDESHALALQRALPASTVVVGSAAGGVIGGHQELEQRSAISLVGARLPQTQIRVMAIHSEQQELDVAKVHAELGKEGADPAMIITLVDADLPQHPQILGLLDTAFPETTIVGSLSNGTGSQPALLVDHKISGTRAVCIALHGGLKAHSIVAQGCRPIGVPMLVTRSEGQVIQELGQKRPLEVMRDLHDSLSERDQQLFQRSLFIGIEMKDQVEYHQGDFLIRDVLGIESTHGGLAVSVPVEQWKAVQFHLIDAETAADNLRQLLRHVQEQTINPLAALLFSCKKRGEGLYGQPSHDTRTIRHFFGDIPVGGLFCENEIGRIDAKTYVHGHTSTFALISET